MHSLASRRGASAPARPLQTELTARRAREGAVNAPARAGRVHARCGPRGPGRRRTGWGAAARVRGSVRGRGARGARPRRPARRHPCAAATPGECEAGAPRQPHTPHPRQPRRLRPPPHRRRDTAASAAAGARAPRPPGRDASAAAVSLGAARLSLEEDAGFTYCAAVGAFRGDVARQTARRNAALTAALRAWLVEGGYEAEGLPVATLLEVVNPSLIVLETNPGSARLPRLQLAMSMWVLWLCLAVSVYWGGRQAAGWDRRPRLVGGVQDARGPLTWPCPDHHHPLTHPPRHQQDDALERAAQAGKARLARHLLSAFALITRAQRLGGTAGVAAAAGALDAAAALAGAPALARAVVRVYADTQRELAAVVEESFAGADPAWRRGWWRRWCGDSLALIESFDRELQWAAEGRRPSVEVGRAARRARVWGCHISFSTGRPSCAAHRMPWPCAAHPGTLP
jgi:hypothetical protein